MGQQCCDSTSGDSLSMKLPSFAHPNVKPDKAAQPGVSE